MSDAPVEFVLVVRRAATQPGSLVDGARFVLRDGQVTIGRAPDADIVLDDATVSRSHCRIERVAGGWELQNLSRANGLFVNRRAVEPGDRHRVESLERLQIGGVLFDVEQLPETMEVRRQLDSEPRSGRASGERAPLFAFHVDAGTCAVQSRGRLTSLAPSAAKAFLALCRSPGELVHAWDIQEAVGAPANLARLMSEVRVAIRELVEHDVVTLDELVRRAVTVHGSEEVDAEDLGAVLRRFIHARRGHGYLVCLAEDDVEVRDAR